MITNADAFLLSYLQVLGSATAYELSRLLARSPVSAVTAGPSSVYATVRSLSERGLISGEVVPQTKRPTKTIWSLTPKGLGKFLKWVATPATQSEYRTSWPVFELKCVRCQYLDPETRSRFLKQQRAILEEYKSAFAAFLERHKRNLYLDEVSAVTLSHVDLDLALLERLEAL